MNSLLQMKGPTEMSQFSKNVHTFKMYKWNWSSKRQNKSTHAHTHPHSRATKRQPERRYPIKNVRNLEGWVSVYLSHTHSHTRAHTHCTIGYYKAFYKPCLSHMHKCTQKHKYTHSHTVLPFLPAIPGVVSLCCQQPPSLLCSGWPLPAPAVGRLRWQFLGWKH